MKNTKALKFFAVMAVALLLALTSVFASAEEDAKTSPLAPPESSPTIVSQNIAYQGSFNLCYAVDAASVSGGSVTVNIYDAEKNYLRSYTATTTESITPVGGSEVEVYVVITSPIATKDMGDVYYAQAVDVDGNVGALKRYSVAEYLFEMLYDNGIADAEEGTKRYNQKLFFEELLKVGSLAQTVLINDKLAEGAVPEVLVEDYGYVRVTDGLVDGYLAGAYANGAKVSLTYTGTKANFVGWEVKYLDGTSKYLSTNTFTVDAHAVVVPYYSNVATFEDGYLSTSKLRNFFFSSGSAILAENAANYESVITKYSVVSDPADAANKVLKVVCTGEKTQTAGFTRVDVSNDNPGGNTYVFETKIYLEAATWTGDVTQIHFVNSSIANIVSFRIYTTQGSDTFAIYQNNSNGSGTGVIASDLPRCEWVSLRIEWYQGDSADNTRAKIYVGVADGEMECVADIAAYLTPAFTTELSQVRIAHQRTNASTVYFDNIALSRIDKAYSAE